LTTGEVLQMWQLTESKDTQSESKEVEFYFDDVEHPAKPVVNRDWICSWQFKPANPVTLAKFSSDGLLFATIGKVMHHTIIIMLYHVCVVAAMTYLLFWCF